MGIMTEDYLSAGQYLEENYDVPRYRCPLPIGLEGTDTFINVIAQIYDKDIPEGLKKERGRVLDA